MMPFPSRFPFLKSKHMGAVSNEALIKDVEDSRLYGCLQQLQCPMSGSFHMFLPSFYPLCWWFAFRPSRSRLSLSEFWLRLVSRVFWLELSARFCLILTWTLGSVSALRMFSAQESFFMSVWLSLVDVLTWTRLRSVFSLLAFTWSVAVGTWTPADQF